MGGLIRRVRLKPAQPLLPGGPPVASLAAPHGSAAAAPCLQGQWTHTLRISHFAGAGTLLSRLTPSLQVQRAQAGHTAVNA